MKVLADLFQASCRQAASPRYNRLYAAGMLLVLLLGTGLTGFQPKPAGLLIRVILILGLLGLGLFFYLCRDNTRYLQLALFIPFTIDYLLHFLFILLTVLLFRRRLLPPFSSPLKPIYLLLGWSFFSFAVNQFSEFNPLSLPFFLLTFFLPFTYFSLFFSQAESGGTGRLLNFFTWTVLLNNCLIVLQLLLLPDLHIDLYGGGTGKSHFAAALASLAFILSLLALAGKKPAQKKGRHLLILISTPLVFFFNDAKQFLVLISFFGLLICLLHLIRRPAWSLALLGLLAAVFSYWIFFTPGKLPLSAHHANLEYFQLPKISAAFFASPKIRLVRLGAGRLAADPVKFIIGTGPGTFISKAANLKHYLAEGKNIRSFAGLWAGLPWLDAWLEPVYTRQQLQYQELLKVEAYRTGNLFSSKSTLLAVWHETGLIGLLLLLYFFLNLSRRARPPGGRPADPRAGPGRPLPVSVHSERLFLFLLAGNPELRHDRLRPAGDSLDQGQGGTKPELTSISFFL